jgi:hypothetical protein
MEIACYINVEIPSIGCSVSEVIKRKQRDWAVSKRTEN